MNEEVSTGLVGSWYFSCATSSCRNACGSSIDWLDALLAVVGAVVGTVEAALTASIGLVIGSHPSV